MRWDQMGWQDKPLWCIGGDGAMFDIGFQSLSRLLASGMNIKVFVLDTQVYSNTGGQASTSSYTGQNTKMSVHGKAFGGKQERRKEIAQIAMMHPRTYVAQTTCAHINHFYKAVLGALEFDGPAIIVCYTTCQPEHGVADNMAADQARLAVDSRAFPLLIYDPRKGDTIKERLSLQGNPAVKDDWYVNPKTKEDGQLHRLRPQRGPLLQALRQGRQSVGDAAPGQAGSAGELARAAGAGGSEVKVTRSDGVTGLPLLWRRTRHEPGGLGQTLEFLKRTRAELRQLRRVLAWKDRLQVHDVNRDVFEVSGLGYADPEIIPVLNSLNAAYDPSTVHQPTTRRAQAVQARPLPPVG